MSPPPDDTDDTDAGTLRPLVRFRLATDVRPPVKEDATVELRALAPAAWDALEQRYGTLAVRHVFPPARLQPLLRRAADLAPSIPSAPFERWFQTVLPAGSEAREAHAAFRALPVDVVEVETRLEPLPVGNYDDEPLYADQTHLHPAPAGVSIGAVFDVPGGRGQEQVLCDVERGWATTHTDLAGLTTQLLPGGQNHTASMGHGTHVLGTVAAALNDFGCLGVASGILKAVLSSEIRVGLADTAPDTVAAIFEGLETCNPGDVMLLELQKDPSIVDPAIPAATMKVPCEVLPSVADAIRLAVALHVVVVEAAGNGHTGGTQGVDLDKLDVGGVKPFAADAPDSGAILVGQASWNGSAWKPRLRGCFGTRIDCFASGVSVVAPSTSVADPNVFNQGFDGTSAASAIVAGVALAVQGMMRARPGHPYVPPLPMRRMLRNPEIGTLSLGGLDAAGLPADGIGVMPDLGKLATQLGLLPDLYLRDHLGDTGVPHTGPLSTSPDVIVRVNAPADPAAAYGPGPNENADDLSETVQENTPAKVFVRVRNRGGVDAVGAQARVFWSTPSTLVQPWSWTPVGPSVVLPDVLAGGPLVVSPAIDWPHPPAAGHYCFVAIVGHTGDPILDPTTLATLDDFATFLQWIRTENGITWRNFDVVSAPPTPSPWPPEPLGFGGGPGGGGDGGGGSGDERGARRERKPRPEWRLPFHAIGAADAPRAMALSVRASLPTGATLHLELPAATMQVLGLAGAFGESSDIGVVPLVSKGTTELGLLPFGLRQRIPMTLRAHVPQKAWGPQMDIAIVQRHATQEVGRITWRLRPTVGNPSDPT